MAALGEQRRFGLEVLARQGPQLLEGLIELPISRLAARAGAVIGEPVALAQQRLVLGVDGLVSDTEVRLPGHAVRHGLIVSVGLGLRSRAIRRRRRGRQSWPTSSFCCQRSLVQSFAFEAGQADFERQFADLQRRHEADVADMGEALALRLAEFQAVVRFSISR